MDAFSDDLEVAIPDNPFEALVGDGKKYSSPEALAKAVFHANAHIARIQAENEEFRTQLNSNKRIEDMFKELQNANQQREHTSVPEEAGEGNKEVDIESLVETALAKRTAKQTFETNFKEANTALLELYGQDAKQQVQAKADELGLSMDEMKQLAGKSKKAFLALFKAPESTNKAPDFTPPRSQNRPPVQLPDTYKQSYWNDLFKKDRKAWEARTVERYDAAMKAGESFFD